MSGTARAIDADYIHACFFEHTRDFGWVVAKYHAIIPRERDRGHDWQVADLSCRFDGFLDFIKITHCFNDDQICTCFSQRADLFSERSARLLGLHASKRRDAHAERAYRTGNKHISKRCGDDAFG